MGQVDIPVDHHYAMADGYVYKSDEIRRAVESAKLPFEMSEEAGLPKQQHETKKVKVEKET